MNKRNVAMILVAIGAVILIACGTYFAYHQYKKTTAKKTAVEDTVTHDYAAYANDPTLVGPWGNVPENAPNKDEFKLFAIPVPGILSRSEQPTLDEFRWMKENGWKSVVDFRQDGEKDNQYAVDSKLPGFNELGLRFLSLPIKDGGNPTNEQADQYLKFVTDPQNQPANVHCAAGIGRTGIAVALYRYSVEGWPMDKAIAESSLYTKSLGKTQQKWLQKWASNNAAGAYAK